MAKTGAQGAAGWWRFDRRLAGSRARRMPGNLKILAAPAYRRLLAAEPLFKRAVPALIVAFLIIIAGVRAVSLMSWQESIENDARSVLALSSLQVALAAERRGEAFDRAADGAMLIADARRLAGLTPAHVLAIFDEGGKVVADSSAQERFLGRRLEDVLQGGQPLFLFGERAGVLEIEAFGETWFAALAYTADKRFGAIAMVPSAAVFSEWRRGVTLNVTLFVMTATLICIILYAYFAQVSRAEAADRLYLQ